MKVSYLPIDYLKNQIRFVITLKFKAITSSFLNILSLGPPDKILLLIKSKVVLVERRY